MATRECDYCDNTESNIDSLKEWDGDKCPTCILAEKSIPDKPKMSEPSPISVNEVLKQSREVDNSVQVRTDLFNAKTLAIVDLKKAIDEDDAIENKQFTLAQELMNRFNRQKSVIFELNEKLVAATNEQRAIQVYLNQLANKLRQEEREKLKLQDINYKPKPVPTQKVTRKRIKLSKKKIDKKELVAAANELGVSQHILHMLIIQKNLTVQEAAKVLKKNIEAAKAKSTAEQVKLMVNKFRASKKTRIPVCCSFDCCGNKFGRIERSKYTKVHSGINRIKRTRRYAKRAEKHQVRMMILQELNVGIE